MKRRLSFHPTYFSPRETHAALKLNASKARGTHRLELGMPTFSLKYALKQYCRLNYHHSPSTEYSVHRDRQLCRSALSRPALLGAVSHVRLDQQEDPLLSAPYPQLQEPISTPPPSSFVAHGTNKHPSPLRAIDIARLAIVSVHLRVRDQRPPRNACFHRMDPPITLHIHFPTLTGEPRSRNCAC